MSQWKQPLWAYMQRCAGVEDVGDFEFTVQYRTSSDPALSAVRVRPVAGKDGLVVPVDGSTLAALERVDQARLFRSVNDTGRALFESARRRLLEAESKGTPISLNQFLIVVALPLSNPDVSTLAGNVYAQFRFTAETLERCFEPAHRARLLDGNALQLMAGGRLLTNGDTPEAELDEADADDDSAEADDEVAEVAALNTILFGPPGTGKSYQVEQRVRGFLGRRMDDSEAVFRVTFHPETSYYDFVGVEKPVVGWLKSTAAFESADGVSRFAEPRAYYDFVPGAFARAVAQASRVAHPVALVIEEINRGNCAAIFGDVFQLLDRDDDGWSEYPITLDPSFARWLAAKVPNGSRVLERGRLRLPPNLYLYATMNTSDQGLFPMDTAFKRRWSMEYVDVDSGQQSAQIRVGGQTVAWSRFLEVVNAHIVKFTRSDDKQVGPWFLKANDGEMSRSAVAAKLLHYLWDDVFRAQTDVVFDPEIRTFGALRRRYLDGGAVFNEALRQQLLPAP